MSAGGVLWAPGVALINYKGDNIPGSFFNQFVTDIQAASLACAARLADATCPQSRPAGAWSYSI